MSLYSFCIGIYIVAFFQFFSFVESNYHTAFDTDSVLLSCQRPELLTFRSRFYWIYQDEVLFINYFSLSHRFAGNIVLLKNSSLYINPVSLEHEGVYKCTTYGSEIVEQHILEVQVRPRILMYINGNEYNASQEDIFYGDVNKEISVICKATGAKPVANLSLVINNEIFSPSQADTVTVENLQDNRTFDSILDLKTRLWKRSGNITCLNIGQEGFPGQGVTVHYQNYNFDLTLMVNGQRKDDVIYIDDKDDVIAECYAQNDFSVNFSWLVNGRHIDVPRTSTLIKVNKVFYSKSALRLRWNEFNGTITCRCEVEDTGSIREISQNFFINVTPRIELMINGRACQNGTLITSHYDVIVATCYAIGARPDVHLTWSINDELIEPTNHVYNRRGQNMTNDVLSMLSITPEEKKGHITCHVKGHPTGNTFLQAKYQINGVSEFQSLMTVQNRMTVFITIATVFCSCTFQLY